MAALEGFVDERGPSVLQSQATVVEPRFVGSLVAMSADAQEQTCLGQAYCRACETKGCPFVELNPLTLDGSQRTKLSLELGRNREGRCRCGDRRGTQFCPKVWDASAVFLVGCGSTRR